MNANLSAETTVSAQGHQPDPDSPPAAHGPPNTPHLRFFAPGVPAPKGSKAYKGHRNGKPILVESAAKKLGVWMPAVAYTARSAMNRAKVSTIPAGVPVTTAIVYVMPRPKRMAAKGVDVPHVSQPDRDKLDRGVFDALTQALVVADDNQFSGGWSQKRYANANEPTGAWITVYTGPVVVEVRSA